MKEKYKNRSQIALPEKIALRKKKSELKPNLVYTKSHRETTNSFMSTETPKS